MGFVGYVRSRKIARQQERLAFDAFTRHWREIKKYQLHMEAKGEPVPDKEKLGRKPNFQQWKFLAKKAQVEALAKAKEQIAAAIEKAAKEKPEDIPSLEWDEEETQVGKQAEGQASVQGTQEQAPVQDDGQEAPAGVAEATEAQA